MKPSDTNKNETLRVEIESHYAKRGDGYVYYYWRAVGSNCWNEQKTAMKELPYSELKQSGQTKEELWDYECDVCKKEFKGKPYLRVKLCEKDRKEFAEFLKKPFEHKEYDTDPQELHDTQEMLDD